LAEPILITLFQYGALTPADIAMARLSLQAYSLGLVAFMLVKVLAPGFYARSDMVTPVRIGIIAMVAYMVLNATQGTHIPNTPWNTFDLGGKAMEDYIQQELAYFPEVWGYISVRQKTV
jgi:hypothetical protein